MPEQPRLSADAEARQELPEPSARTRSEELGLALLPLQRPKTLRSSVQRARPEQIPSQQRGQKLERLPARVHGRHVRAHPGGDVRGQLIRTQWGQAAGLVVLPIVLLKSVPPRLNGHCVRGELPPQADVARRFPVQSFRHREPSWATAPHQNRPAAKAGERVGRRTPPASFCGAAGARASIYACKAFNTEERAGSIGHLRTNHMRQPHESARMSL